jgi:hypothetical protein
MFTFKSSRRLVIVCGDIILFFGWLLMPDCRSGRCVGFSIKIHSIFGVGSNVSKSCLRRFPNNPTAILGGTQIVNQIETKKERGRFWALCSFSNYLQ